MKYRVITPFARLENFAKLSERLQPRGVEWHLLVDDGLNWDMQFPADSWIKVFHYPKAQPFWRAWANHLNAYIATAEIPDDIRCVIMNDDDLVPIDFFTRLDGYSGEFIVCSMMRGHHSPPGGHGHPTTTLVACPQNLRVGAVGCEEAIVSGRLFKTMRFADDICADGMAIVELAKRHPPVFAADVVVYFNALEVGRWTRLP